MTSSLQQLVDDRLLADGYLVVPLPRRISDCVEAAIQSARVFFSTSQAEKLKSGLPFGCGYRPPGIEYSSSSDVPDAIESFTVSNRTNATGMKLDIAPARELHDRMIAASDLLEPFAEALAVVFAKLVSDADWSTQLRAAFRVWSRVQVNYSVPAQSKAEFINELHEDGHLLTIACSTAPGLEVRKQDGSFVSITAPPGSAVVMPGQISWLLSGGRINPLYHRVRRIEEQQERLALLFFGDISPRACQPWIHNHVNAGADIGANVLTNYSRFGLRDFPLE